MKSKYLLLTFLFFYTTFVFPQKYKVQKGDTAYGICRKLGVNFFSLKGLNANKNLNKIKVGDILNIPAENNVKRLKNNQFPKNKILNNYIFLKPIKMTIGKNNRIKIYRSKFSIKYFLNSGKIIASYNGIVTFAGELNFLGKVVFIKHFNNIYTVYEIYNGKLSVKKGDKVRAGDTIALNRNNKKMKLKFHLLKGTMPINPYRFIN